MAALAPSVPHKLHDVQALLRARKLDRTLTSEGPAPGEAVASFATEAVNRGLRGGLPRGQMSELHGPVSSGRTSLAWAALAAATARGEWVALVDTFDRFDPARAAAAGVELSRVLWVRGQALSKTSGALDPAWVPGERSVQGPGTLLERTMDRAIKAVNLVAQSSVCTLVVLDLIDGPAQALRGCLDPRGCGCSAWWKGATWHCCCWQRCPWRAVRAGCRSRRAWERDGPGVGSRETGDRWDDRGARQRQRVGADARADDVDQRCRVPFPIPDCRLPTPDCRLPTPRS